ncbi:MAG: hypothetical protein IT169_01215 [Bryobacterales bacterium]|nr:hypothetical protein [Bryobacterales bacterium]
MALLALLAAVDFRAVVTRFFVETARFATRFFFTVLAFFATVAFFAELDFFTGLAFFAVRAGCAATAATFTLNANRKRRRANRAKNIMIKPSANGSRNIKITFRTAVSVFSTERVDNVKVNRSVENRLGIHAKYHAGKTLAIAEPPPWRIDWNF